MFGSCTSDTRVNIAKMKEGGRNPKTASLKFTVRDHSHVGEETETSVRQSSKVKRLSTWRRAQCHNHDSDGDRRLMVTCARCCPTQVGCGIQLRFHSQPDHRC